MCTHLQCLLLPVKPCHGGDRKSKGQNVLLKTTAEKIAEEYGVTDKTIKRDAQFSQAVDKIAAEIGEEAKHAILTGRANVPKKDVEKLIELVHCCFVQVFGKFYIGFV